MHKTFRRISFQLGQKNALKQCTLLVIEILSSMLKKEKKKYVLDSTSDISFLPEVVGRPSCFRAMMIIDLPFQFEFLVLSLRIYYQTEKNVKRKEQAEYTQFKVKILSTLVYTSVITKEIIRTCIRNMSSWT